jgi:hypothetical protein
MYGVQIGHRLGRGFGKHMGVKVMYVSVAPNAARRRYLRSLCIYFMESEAFKLHAMSTNASPNLPISEPVL